MMRRERAGRAQHKIAVAEARERHRLGTADGQRQHLSRRCGHLVADIGKGDEAVEQVQAVGAAADDVQVEIDLGGGEDGDSRAGQGFAQPPRSAGWFGAAGAGVPGEGAAGVAEAGVEGGPRPFSSFDSSGCTSSLSGPNCSARRH